MLSKTIEQALYNGTDSENESIVIIDHYRTPLKDRIKHGNIFRSKDNKLPKHAIMMHTISKSDSMGKALVKAHGLNNTKGLYIHRKGSVGGDLPQTMKNLKIKRDLLKSEGRLVQLGNASALKHGYKYMTKDERRHAKMITDGKPDTINVVNNSK